MDIIHHRFPSMDYSFTPLSETPIIDHGIYGGESNTVIYKPEQLRKTESVILVPGIGINTKTVEGSFTEIAHKISQQLSIKVAIALEGEWNNKTTSGYPETGITFALRNAIKDLDNSNVHIIAFSHNSTNTLIASAMSDVLPRVKSITLVAPTDSPFKIEDIFRKSGRQVNRIEDEVFVSSRRIHLQTILKQDSNPHYQELFEKKLTWSVGSLKQNNILIRVLHGGTRDDIVPVAISENLTRMIGSPLEIVEPNDQVEKTDSKVHDFTTEKQLQFLIDTINEVVK